jgi:CubicO group peptidase (beta-lactamase class C family)
MRIILSVVLFFSVWLIPSVIFAQNSNAQQRTEKVNLDAFQGFDAFVEAEMKQWKVPGLSIAVIKDGNIVLIKGYGYRDVQKKLPVTTRTLMPIGSNTKAFTASVLGTLVDEKKLDWDEPVRSYMPDFRLSDEVAERLTTARDLMSHRTGLPRHDSLYYGRSYTRQELYSRLRYLDFNKTFRQRWQYNNLMVMTAGILAERITNRTWEDLVRERVFVPLGMTRSNFTIADITRSDDYSIPYGDVAGVSTAIPFRDIEAVGPAGSINSSAEEMIRFVQMQIDKGTYQGKQILSKDAATEMQYPQINFEGGRPLTRISDEDESSDGLGPGAYGLGLSVTTYRGRKLLYHGGGIDGFISDMAWLPDERIGVVVLTNWGEFNPVPSILERNVFDRLLGLNQIDWSSRSRAYWARIQKQFGNPPKPEPPPTTTPSHPLADYTGSYVHPGYGVITITLENGQLAARLDHLAEPIPLEHDRYDVFRPKLPQNTTLSRWASRRLTFYYDNGGKVNRLTTSMEGNVSDIIFKRTGN